MRKVITVALLLLAVTIYGIFLLNDRGETQGRASSAGLGFYTSAGATTAQAPFWAAVRDGWPPGMGVETRFWKDLDDLRNTMLAGKGDIWVGHTDGFAQAAMRGAPVTLVAVTAWRKFHFITADPDAQTLQVLASKLAQTGERLAVAPPDSPAFAVLAGLALRGGPAFTITRNQPKQLMLEALRGDVRHMLVPEPLATTLMMKLPHLRRVACLEEEYSRHAGGSGMLPIAGIAVRTGLLHEHPKVVARLVAAMTGWAAGQTPDTAGEAVLSVLPEATIRELGAETVRLSLRNDPVRVVPAWAAREDVLAYLSLVFPEAVGPQGTQLPPSFFMEKR